MAANRAGGQVRTDFSTFPTPQFAKVCKETIIYIYNISFYKWCVTSLVKNGCSYSMA